MEWPSVPTAELNKWIETLNRVSAEIWKIETEKPFQKLVI
jgi:hypothetical protein